MKKKSMAFLIIGLVLIASGLIYTGLSVDGLAVYSPAAGNAWLDAFLAAGAALLAVFAFSRDREAEEVKKYMESCHGFKLPPIDVVYSDDVYFAEKGGTLLGKGCYFYDKKLKRDTIVLPTKKAVSDLISDKYEELRSLYKNPAFRKKNSEKSGEILSSIGFYADFYKHFDIRTYMSKAHEIAHKIGDIYRLRLIECEGVSEAYEFKMALLGIKNKKLPLEETIDTIRVRLNDLKENPDTDHMHKISFLYVIGHDFDIPEDTGEPQLDGLIARLDEKISLVIERRRKQLGTS